MVEQEEQKKKIWDWETQKSVDHLLVDRIVGSVDPQYLEARSKDYLGFTKETTKPLIEYIRTDWCRVSTHHKMKTRKHSQGAMGSSLPHRNLRTVTRQEASTIEEVRCARARQGDNPAICRADLLLQHVQQDGDSQMGVQGRCQKNVGVSKHLLQEPLHGK